MSRFDLKLLVYVSKVARENILEEQLLLSALFLSYYLNFSINSDPSNRKYKSLFGKTEFAFFLV